MTREERIEAAAERLPLGGDDWAADWVKEIALGALKAAFPEYFNGTHVLLPREPTEELVRVLQRWTGQEAAAMKGFWYEIQIACKQSKPEQATAP